MTRLIADGNLRNALFGLLSSAPSGGGALQRPLRHRHRSRMAVVGGGGHELDDVGNLPHRTSVASPWIDLQGVYTMIRPSMMIVRISLVLAAFVGASSASAATVRVAVGQQRVVERSNISKVAIGNPKTPTCVRSASGSRSRVSRWGGPR